MSSYSLGLPASFLLESDMDFRDNWLAHFKSAVEQEMTAYKGNAAAAYKAVGDKLEKGKDTIYQHYNQKSGKVYPTVEMMVMLEKKYGNGRPPGWSTQPLPGAVEARTSTAQPSLADMLKRLSNEIQAAPHAAQQMVADAFVRWAKEPHQWELLVSKLEMAKIDVGSAPQEPRYVVGETAAGESAVRVPLGAMKIAKELSVLPESMQTDQIFDEVLESVRESKQRNGFSKWPFQDNRFTQRPVEKDQRVNPEGTEPMTTAARFRLREAASRGQQPKE